MDHSNTKQDGNICMTDTTQAAATNNGSAFKKRKASPDCAFSAVADNKVADSVLSPLAKDEVGVDPIKSNFDDQKPIANVPAESIIKAEDHGDRKPAAISPVLSVAASTALLPKHDEVVDHCKESDDDNNNELKLECTQQGYSKKAKREASNHNPQNNLATNTVGIKSMAAAATLIPPAQPESIILDGMIHQQEGDMEEEHGSDLALAYSVQDLMEAVTREYPSEALPSGDIFKTELTHYQRQCLAFMDDIESSTNEVKSGWLCSEVGVGKTAVVIALIVSNPMPPKDQTTAEACRN